MTADDLMALVTHYTEACDDLGKGLFAQTAEDTTLRLAKANALWKQVLAEVTRLHAEAAKSERRAIDLVAALKWYADGEHFTKADPDAWDTVSGEPQNWWCDEAGTATVEDGSIAKMALAGELNAAQIQGLEDGHQVATQSSGGPTT